MSREERSSSQRRIDRKQSSIVWAFFLMALVVWLAACGRNRGTVPAAEEVQDIPPQTANCVHDAELLSNGPGTELGVSGFVTKSWRVRNSGDCAWSEAYQVTTVEAIWLDDAGSRFITDTLSQAVAPGTEVDIEVGFHAPVSDGVYSTTWQIEDLDGNKFGDLLPLSIVKSGTVVCSSTECDMPMMMIATCTGDACDDPLVVGESALAVCASGDCGVPALGVYACDSAPNAAVRGGYALDPSTGEPVICVYGVEPGDMVVGTVTDPWDNTFIYNGPALALPEVEELPTEAESIDEAVAVTSTILPGRWGVDVVVDGSKVELPPLDVVQVE